jgi:hypothetical protein
MVAADGGARRQVCRERQYAAGDHIVEQVRPAAKKTPSI